MALVQIDDVQAVAQLRSASQCENLVRGRIPGIQTPSELRVRFDWKETERAVDHPFDPGLPAVSLNDCPPKRFPVGFEIHVKARRLKSGGIRAYRGSKRNSGIVEHIDVTR